VTARWRYLGADGSEAGSSEPFADREAAEAWLAEAWEELAGVADVVLEVDGEETYRMSMSGEGGTER
jgi:hypothetical protein